MSDRSCNCFKCWHCRRVDGTSSCCVCTANVTKTNPPELIYEPYGGVCPAFYDKSIEECKYIDDSQEDADD